MCFLQLIIMEQGILLNVFQLSIMGLDIRFNENVLKSKILVHKFISIHLRDRVHIFDLKLMKQGVRGKSHPHIPGIRMGMYFLVFL